MRSKHRSSKVFLTHLINNIYFLEIKSFILLCIECESELKKIPAIKTSRVCFKCKEVRCENFMTHPDTRPFKKREDKLVHGLLKCCECVWNRDVNGANNVFFAMKSIVDRKERLGLLEQGFLISCISRCNQP